MSNNISNYLFSATKEILKKQMRASNYLNIGHNESKLKASLTILTVNMIRLFVEINEQVSKNNHEIAAILLRSLLEINANVNFLVKNKSEEICTKFLRTSGVAYGNLLAIKNGKVIKDIEWSDKSISNRVSDLGEDQIVIYKLLSSYVHADAGMMTANRLQDRKFINDLFSAYASFYCWDILVNLAEAGVIKKIEFNALFIKTLKSKLPELRK
jgi:hypothetical protein